MRRKGILSLAIVIGLVMTSLLVPIVSAKGNPHFRDRTLGWAMGSLTATGVVVGLANEPYLVELYAEGSAEGICVNPAGNREVQGRNPILVAVEESDEARTDQNGSVSFVLTASEETQYILVKPTPKEFGCPNKSWHVEVVPGSTEWTGATLSLYTLDGELLVAAYFECDVTKPGICTPK